jgi:RNA polymerase sigma-54 factor
MAMELRQQVKMTQQLRMTPQLQQAIKLLQLSRMELIETVRQEMVENPVLEEQQEIYEPSLERQVDDQGSEAKDPPEVEASDEAAMDNVDWESYLENYSGPSPANSYKGYNTDELPGVEQTLSTEESLFDHLIEQLRLSALSEEEQHIGAMILGNLDERGYFTGTTIEDIALEMGADVETVTNVIEIVQTFDPVGVAARDLRECLLIQIDERYPDDQALRTVVEEHISDLERKSYSKIARALGADKEEVVRIAKKIRTLDPHPGRAYSSDEARYITPDIYIREHDGEFVPMLNEDGLPKLKVSNYYRQELKRKREEGEKDEVKDYIQDKLRGAMWLIRSIHQRQSTILKVTESIIKFQHDFFEKGVEHLKPLVLRDVADDIEMHESTVSRVTTNKYVHTPRGTYELKFFFNSSITNRSGEDLASEAVKAKIRDIISREDPKKPLSDAKIAKALLEESDLEIARRTVAKYRESMGILSSSKRKRMF